MNNSDQIAILNFKSPADIAGGHDLRSLGIARALSTFASVSVLPIFGSNTGVEIKPNLIVLESSGFDAPENHELLKWQKEHPDDPYGIYSSAAVREFVTRSLERLAPKRIIANRLIMWRILEDIHLSTKSTLILDLDESAARLHRSFQTKARTSIAWKFHAEFQSLVAAYEQQVIEKPSRIFVSSEIEASEIADSLGATAKVSVIPNALEDNISQILRDKQISDESLKVLFPANFAYPPNRAALEEIVTEIAPHLPKFTFRIVGSGLSVRDSWRLSNISYESPIYSMVEEFESCDLLIAPLRYGAGTRIKVLEAMKHQIPVLATEFAVEGLDLIPDVHYLRAETASEFVAKINEISSKERAVAEIVRNAYELVNSRYSVSAITPILHEALSSS